MRTAFTLIEILIVVVIMAILAATIIPQFTDSTKDAQVSTTVFNLNTLRAQIELFKAHHGGTAPATLAKLTEAGTDLSGNTVGPYLVKIPNQTISSPANNSEVAAFDANGGWYYIAGTGEVRINDPAFQTE
jgi:prepilin-type N-terminal cleavage/methylation domain-containing protein